MKQGKITSTKDLTEGGCNACGIVECIVYTLDFENKEIVLGDLTVTSLLMAILQKSGWKQDYVINMMDEYTLFKKEQKEVKLVEDYDQLTYSNGTKEIQVFNFLKDAKKLTEEVNKILENIFEEEKILFSFEEE